MNWKNTEITLNEMKWIQQFNSIKIIEKFNRIQLKSHINSNEINFIELKCIDETFKMIKW